MVAWQKQTRGLLRSCPSTDVFTSPRRGGGDDVSSYARILDLFDDHEIVVHAVGHGDDGGGGALSETFASPARRGACSGSM